MNGKYISDASMMILRAFQHRTNIGSKHDIVSLCTFDATIPYLVSLRKVSGEYFQRGHDKHISVKHAQYCL